MAGKNKSDNQDDNRRPRVRLPAQWFKIMSGIVLVVLQILLLLLRGHFNRNNDHEKAIEAIKEAQSKLADLATAFETKIRYSASPKVELDRVQDSMDEERKEISQHE
jgi:hypothetical protein